MSGNEINTEFTNIAEQLIVAGRFFDQKGWVPATSGNFSARLSNNSIAITVSGKHKGCLLAYDIMLCDIQGNAVDGKIPSAETAIHAGLYRYDPGIKAVMHIHSVNSSILDQFFGSALQLKDYELLKAFEGVKTHQTQLQVPIFPNNQDMNTLLDLLSSYLADNKHCKGFVIAGHGLYTWASSIEKAVYQVEALECLLECELRSFRVNN